MAAQNPTIDAGSREESNKEDGDRMGQQDAEGTIAGIQRNIGGKEACGALHEEIESG